MASLKLRSPDQVALCCHRPGPSPIGGRCSRRRPRGLSVVTIRCIVSFSVRALLLSLDQVYHASHRSTMMRRRSAGLLSESISFFFFSPCSFSVFPVTILLVIKARAG